MGEYRELLNDEYQIVNKMWLDGMDILHAYIKGQEELLGKMGEIPLPFREGLEWKSFEGFVFRVEDHHIIKVYDPFEAGEKDPERDIW